MMSAMFWACLWQLAESSLFFLATFAVSESKTLQKFWLTSVSVVVRTWARTQHDVGYAMALSLMLGGQGLFMLR
jgi:hypothetical protein